MINKEYDNIEYITFLVFSMKNFMNFVREQGVVGLAVGFILGGAVSKLVTSMVADLVNPLLGILLGKAQGLTTYTFMLSGAEVRLGSFLSSLIDFIVIAAIVYIGVKKLGLDKMDKKKEIAEAKKEEVIKKKNKSKKKK
jgi:large conductance mechanosensitive channel